MIIGNRIREAREAINLSQKQLAEKLEMDPSQYSKIERGKVMPTLLQIIEIGKIVEKSLDWLVIGEYTGARSKQDPVDNYKDQLALAKQNISLLKEIQGYKDHIHTLENELTALKSKRSAQNKSYSLVAEPQPKLK